MREDSSFPSFFGSINAKHFAFFLDKIYLSISRAALILLAFLSLGWEALLILKAGKYGKKFSASFGKFLSLMRVPRIKGGGLQSPAEKM